MRDVFTKSAPFAINLGCIIACDMFMMRLISLDAPEVAHLIGVTQSTVRGICSLFLYGIMLKGRAILVEIEQVEAGREKQAANNSDDEESQNAGLLKNEAALESYVKIGILFRQGLMLSGLLTLPAVAITLGLSYSMRFEPAAAMLPMQPYFLCFSPVFLLRFLYNVGDQMSLVEGRVWPQAIIGAFTSMVTAVAGFFLRTWFGVNGVAYGYLAGTALGVMLYAGWLSHGLSQYCLWERKLYLENGLFQSLWQLLTKSFPIVKFGLIEQSSLGFLSFFIGAKGGVKLLSVTLPAFLYRSFLAHVAFAFGQGAAGLVYKKLAKKEACFSKKARSYIHQSIGVMSLVSSAFLLVSVFKPFWLIQLFLANETLWSQAVWPLRAAMIGQFADNVRSIFYLANGGIAKALKRGDLSVNAVRCCLATALLVLLPTGMLLFEKEWLNAEAAFIALGASTLLSGVGIASLGYRALAQCSNVSPSTSR